MIQWDESLATGVKEIDKEHKEIIARINKLISMTDKEKELEIDKTLRFLGGYVIDHFAHEEEYMIKYQYPEYDEHKGEHIRFLKSYSSLKKLFDSEGSSALIINATEKQAVEWLVKHIQQIDKKMAFFLQSKMKKA
ncbi:MAG: hemerythrin family protein [Nitrospirae bacterium]|uniref:bacteriohemerythrin n=1 Tax=Candidatus Magnetobacterium casense TaxID=1455061 RepID=UPI00058B9736|nr:bacteriohemerythrin [Candidatus Magnetobacterium casensis]MBF0338944.1 hemerythrin family protein [Nitrospirota bacterium]